MKVDIGYHNINNKVWLYETYGVK